MIDQINDGRRSARSGLDFGSSLDIARAPAMLDTCGQHPEQRYSKQYRCRGRHGSMVCRRVGRTTLQGALTNGNRCRHCPVPPQATHTHPLQHVATISRPRLASLTRVPCPERLILLCRLFKAVRALHCTCCISGMMVSSACGRHGI